MRVERSLWGKGGEEMSRSKGANLDMCRMNKSRDIKCSTKLQLIWNCMLKFAEGVDYRCLYPPPYPIQKTVESDGQFAQQ
jgi:hypothetical protein